MISVVDRTITLGGRVWPIAQFQTWWRTPLGLCSRLEDALASCGEHEMNPLFSVVPVTVAVAVAADGTYEEFK